MNTDLVRRFSFHKPDAEGVAKMRAIRRKVRELADLIDRQCPDSTEKHIAFSHLQTVMMHANSSIVQQYPLDENDV